MVWTGYCEEWEQEVRYHDFLMTLICKDVAAFGYLSAKRESSIHLELGFACWFNQKLEKE